MGGAITGHNLGPGKALGMEVGVMVRGCVYATGERGVKCSEWGRGKRKPLVCTTGGGLDHELTTDHPSTNLGLTDKRGEKILRGIPLRRIEIKRPPIHRRHHRVGSPGASTGKPRNIGHSIYGWGKGHHVGGGGRAVAFKTTLGRGCLYSAGSRVEKGGVGSEGIVDQ